MTDRMNSRERMLTAISYGVPDRVPLYLRVFGARVPEHMRHKKAFERVERWHEKGVDDIVDMFAPWGRHPDVRVRSWREAPTKDERYPLLCREYETPAGVLHIYERGTSVLPDERHAPYGMGSLRRGRSDLALWRRAGDIVGRRFSRLL